MSQRTIAIDFDGVIHKYSAGWGDGTIYDAPMEGAARALKKLHNKGYNLVVFTARIDIAAVNDWLEKTFPDVDIKATNQKPQAIAYIDDRAIRFTNWQDILNYF